MANLPPALVAIIVYRLTSMVLGLLIIYMGYRLFMAGLFEKAGALKAAWGDNQLVVKQAAPGTFFSLFGTIVIIWSLAKGFSITPDKTAGMSYFGAGISDTALSFIRGANKRELRMLEIARTAVTGQRITQAQRDSFVVWYKARTAPFDTSAIKVRITP